VTGAAVSGVGLLTGWGDGVSALPADARGAAGGRLVVRRPPPPPGDERLRRATRESLFGIAAVLAVLRDAGIGRDDLRGPGTALLYVTAGGYGASNVAFIGAGAGRGAAGSSPTLHFPYTAPSAVPGEVAIEFGLTGAYEILIGGGAATIDALWRATRLLAGGRGARALVLAVETFEECEALWARGRRLVGAPLVESAACALLVPGAVAAAYAPVAEPSRLERRARARAGETLACAPLIELALARAAGDGDPVTLTGQWRRRRVGLTLGVR